MNTMKKMRLKTAGLGCGFLLGLASGTPVLADDTEILIGAQLNPGQPNILFIIDTSGSMDSEVVVGVDYDPNAQYSGSCDEDRLFWIEEGTGTINLPDCRFNNYVQRNAFRCSTGRTVLAESGHYRDRLAQWDTTLEPPSWTELVRASSSEETDGSIRFTECEADNGKHGDVDGIFYPADGAAGPWSSNPDDGINWDQRGKEYTVYTGHYLNWIEESGTDTTVSTRMQVVKDVADDVLSSISGVNVGLMRFSTNAEGGMVLQEMVQIESGRSEVLDAINSMTPSGSTPLAETLYEAGQYFAGREVDFGAASQGTGGTIQPSVAESQDGSGNYRSPITLQCQRSYAVVLTDGLPTGDTDADIKIQGLPGFSENIGSCTGSCLDEMAAYLDVADLRSGSGFSGDQDVQTFTIGFHTDQELLEDTATGTVPVFDADGNPVLDENGEQVTRPGYFIADDPDELANAFQDIIAAIQADGEVFSAPSVSVDVQNRLTNREDIFFALFQPPARGEKYWEGNLKKYRLGRPAGDSTGTPQILDVNGRAAIDENGEFVDGAQSFWSLMPDEGIVAEGGFVETLTANRRVYSNITSGQLTASSNEVHERNSNLTAELLGVDPSDRDDIIRFARGLNTDGTVRQAIGDPLHSEPLVMAYANDRFALFFGTNDGYLHALDPESTLRGDTDLEHFAFIPRELLASLDDIKANPPQQQFNAVKGYGLDGPVTAWIDETNSNRIVESGERAYLYIGMRRGGRNYYALDVTDVDAPRLAWTITGGTGDFVELGQTWSAPVVSTVNWQGAETNVLFFAGGNDTNQDARDLPSSDDDMGRAVYMVDAESGERLWWASIREEADLTLPEMTHSIPSSLRVMDTNQDGIDDRIYVGDTGGKVWRFDINSQGNGSISGDLFADLGGRGESGNRRFYSPPSVTRITDEHFGNFLTISIGSGHRAHPLETEVDDMFFVIRDRNIFAPPVNPTTQQISYPDPIGLDNLLNITNNVEPSINQLENRQGWYLEFQPGEKSLSSAVSVLDRLFFTTYIPTAPEPSCQPVNVIGSGRLYTIDILSGTPVNYADSPVPSDRYSDLEQGGIPPTPTLVFSDPPPCPDCDADDRPVSEITMMIGTEVLDPVINNIPRRTYWVQEEIDR